MFHTEFFTACLFCFRWNCLFGDAALRDADVRHHFYCSEQVENVQRARNIYVLLVFRFRRCVTEFQLWINYVHYLDYTFYQMLILGKQIMQFFHLLFNIQVYCIKCKNVLSDERIWNSIPS